MIQRHLCLCVLSALLLAPVQSFAAGSACSAQETVRVYSFDKKTLPKGVQVLIDTTGQEYLSNPTKTPLVFTSIRAKEVRSLTLVNGKVQLMDASAPFISTNRNDAIAFYRGKTRVGKKTLEGAHTDVAYLVQKTPTDLVQLPMTVYSSMPGLYWYSLVNESKKQVKDSAQSAVSHITVFAQYGKKRIEIAASLTLVTKSAVCK